MKKTILFLFVLLPVLLSAQFRMVGNGNWTAINDTTYTATITFESDLTGNGFLANQIDIGYYLFTGTAQAYTVISSSNETFSQAELTIVQNGTTNAAPIGLVMVYDQQGRHTIPQIPFGSSGATAQLQAAVDTHNAKQSVAIPETTYNSDAEAIFGGVQNGQQYYLGTQNKYGQGFRSVRLLKTN